MICYKISADKKHNLLHKYTYNCRRVEDIREQANTEIFYFSFCIKKNVCLGNYLN